VDPDLQIRIARQRASLRQQFVCALRVPELQRRQVDQAPRGNRLQSLALRDLFREQRFRFIAS